MILPTRLLRGAAALAIGVAVIGTAVSPTPAAAAVLEKKNEKGSKSESGSGISDVPIIGDLVGGFEGQEPEDVAVGVIQLTAGVAETVVPLVIQAFK